MAEPVAVEVAYALPGQQVVLRLSVASGTTIRQAIERSGVLARFPEIDLRTNRVGVFGKARALDEPLQNGDRVEIYRPLSADPKEARRRRAAQKQRRGQT